MFVRREFGGISAGRTASIMQIPGDSGFLREFNQGRADRVGNILPQIQLAGSILALAGLPYDWRFLRNGRSGNFALPGHTGRSACTMDDSWQSGPGIVRKAKSTLNLRASESLDGKCSGNSMAVHRSASFSQ
jgi:hypothetical protein